MICKCHLVNLELVEDEDLVEDWVEVVEEVGWADLSLRDLKDLAFVLIADIKLLIQQAFHVTLCVARNVVIPW